MTPIGTFDGQSQREFDGRNTHERPIDILALPEEIIDFIPPLIVQVALPLLWVGAGTDVQSDRFVVTKRGNLPLSVLKLGGEDQCLSEVGHRRLARQPPWVQRRR